MSCAGAASNRQLNVHERVCLELVIKNSEFPRNVHEVEEGNNDDTEILEEEVENTSHEGNSRTGKLCLESNSPGIIFACRSESNTILNVISSIRQKIR